MMISREAARLNNDENDFRLDVSSSIIKDDVCENQIVPLKYIYSITSWHGEPSQLITSPLYL